MPTQSTKLAEILRRGIYSLFVFTVGCSLLQPFAAQAQMLEEIIVTAQKREQNLNDVSIAVTAFSGSDIQSLGINEPMDLAKHTTGLLAKNSSNGAAQVEIYLRGVGVADFTSISTPAVGAYVDEVYKPAPSMLTFALFDMERIEVLKGPQGTLYGRNNTAGAVNFISKKPSDQFDAYARAGISKWAIFKAEGAVGGPLSETLSGRFSFSQQSSNDDGPYFNRVSGSEGGKINVTSLRGQLLWEPNEDVKILAKVSWGDEKRAGIFPEHFSVTDPAFPAFPFVPAPFCAAFLAGNRDEGNCVSVFDLNGNRYFEQNDNDPFAADLSLDTLSRSEIFEGVVRIEWELPRVSLTSISAYQDFSRDQDYDVDGSPIAAPDIVIKDDIEAFSQEVRLTSDDSWGFNWLLGTFYSKDSILYFQHLNASGVAPFLNSNGGDQDNESYAVFAHVEYPISDQVQLVGGVRYTHESRDFVGASAIGDYQDLSELLAVNEATNCGILFTAIPLPAICGTNGHSPFGEPLTPDYPSTVEADEVDGKVVLEYRPNEDVLFYAGVSKAFKSGGFSGAMIFSHSAAAPYEPEKLVAYEGGFKATLADGTIQMNGAAFYYDYKGWQATFTKTGDPTARLQNAGDVELYGIEADILWRPTDPLTLKAGFIWMDNEIVESDVVLFDYDTGVPGTIAGNELPNAPEWSFNGLARYEFAVNRALKAAIQLDAAYVGRHFLEVNNRLALSQKGYFLVNGRLSVFSDDRNWQVAVWARNLTNELYFSAGFDLALVGGYVTRYPGLPRSYGVEVVYNWD